jgi:hypothetical protein
MTAYEYEPRPTDRSRIELDEPWQIRFWTRELQCTEPRLRAALEQAGSSVLAVLRHLRG